MLGGFYDQLRRTAWYARLMKINRAGFALACGASRVLLRDSLSDLISADGHRVNPCRARIVKITGIRPQFRKLCDDGSEPYRSGPGVALEPDAYAVLRTRKFGQGACSDDSGNLMRRDRGRGAGMWSNQINGSEQGWTRLETNVTPSGKDSQNRWRSKGAVMRLTSVPAVAEWNSL